MNRKLRIRCQHEFEPFARKMLFAQHGDVYRDQLYIQTVLYHLNDFFQFGDRQIFNLPPRHLKTSLCTICGAVWQLGKNPSSKIIIGTYSENIAADIVYQCRRKMKSPAYREIFPTRIERGQDRALEFATTAGGWLYGVSMAGRGVTGRGADLIIIDDPIAVKDAGNVRKLEEAIHFFDSELRPRFDHPSREKILYVGHRLAEEDLSSYLHDQGDWQRLALPLVADKDCIYPIRRGSWCRERGDVLRADEFSPKTIARLRKQTNFEYLYQQGEGEETMQRIRSEDFHWFRGGAVSSTLPRIVSVDPGHKRTPTGSPSVIQVWAPDGDRFYLLDQWRERASCSDFRSAFLDVCRKHRPNIALIEDTGYGPSLIDNPPASSWLTIVACTPDSRSKRERLAAHLMAIREGCIYLPEGADWTDDYVEEFLTFPANCTDQVDATVQFLDRARSAKWEGLRRPKVVTGGVALASSPRPATPAPLSRAIGAVACASDWRR